MLIGVLAGLVADVRTRRVCDGDRAESLYTRLAEAIRPPLPELSEPTPTELTEPVRCSWLPYPIRLLLSFAEALESAPPHGDAVPVMAAKS